MKSKSLAVILAFLALPALTCAQRAANWRVYKLADGLPESACLSVTLSPQGNILVKHFSLAAISKLDGYSVTNLPSAETATGRVYESPAGQLWSVMPEGLQEFRDGVWESHPLPEIAAEFHSGLARMIDPIPIYPVRQGIVLVLLKEKLIRYNFEDPSRVQTEVLRLADQTRLTKFCSMSPARDGGLWISGTHGLAKVPGPLRYLRPDTLWREYALPDKLQVAMFQEPHEENDGTLTTIAELPDSRQKIIVHFDGQHWERLEPSTEKVRFAWGAGKKFWAASIDSLFLAERNRPGWLENEEISARQYFDLALEPGGAFWLATSEGLFRYAPLLWRRPNAALTSPVNCLTADEDGRVWSIAGGSLHFLQGDQHQEFALPTRPERPQVRAMFPLKDDSLWLDAGETQLRFKPANGSFTPVTVARSKPLGFLKDGTLCVQTFLGGSTDCVLEAHDGTKAQPLSSPPPPAELGSALSAFFCTQNNEYWVASDRGTAWYHDRKWRSFVSTDESLPEGALAFAELPDGKIWAATTDKIWEFDGRDWSTLRTGFDRINALLRARDGSVWVASNNGLYRYFQGAWVENSVEEGLPSQAVRHIVEDHRGTLWAGTVRGLSLYDPDADADPPRSSISGLPETEKSIPEGKALLLRFTGEDKWKYTPRDRLLYSYRLDDRDWSGFSDQSTISFTDLAAGKHYFQLRAMDRNCNIDPRPAQIEFAVVLPWFKETRLVLVLIAGGLAALFFAGLAFNRHQRLVRSYAEVELKVAQRTRELEMANKELVHSQKMNALGTLAAGVAHDFNNILSIIKGSAQIIEDNLSDPAKVRIRVDRIKTVVEQGSGIVKAMLGFSRGSDQQPARWDVNSIVQDTIRLLGDRFLREVEVRFEPAPDLPEVQCARDFVQQILLNFIFNAAEAMNTNKLLTLATRKVGTLPPALVLTPARTDHYVLISVQDFGSGITPENLVRIFEPFFTTKALSARRGTGLGLSMVYELAKKMEAGLAVESEPNRGSTFTLLLPVPSSTTILV